MAIREMARRFGRDVQCHRNVGYAQVTHDLTMQSAVQALSRDQRTALMQWLMRLGPFWEDVREHSSQDDLLECNGKVVTDTAMGEAAYCLAHRIDRSLVSLKPSCWLTSPLSVTWHEDSYERNIEVHNYWDLDDVKAVLESTPVTLESWKNVEVVAKIRRPDLTFADDSFDSLEGHPFNKGAAERLLSRLQCFTGPEE